MSNKTKFRYIRSKDMDKIEIVISELPFKIEIKGNPVWANKQWHLFFNLPDEDNPIVNKFESMDLD